MVVGELIREHRERAGLSQAEVALKVGKTDGAVSQWETGRALPRRDVAFKLDRVLGADGQIAAAMGYQLPSDAPSVVGDLAELQVLVNTHEDRIAALEALVEGMAARLVALAERTTLPDDDDVQRPDGSRAVR